MVGMEEPLCCYPSVGWTLLSWFSGPDTGVSPGFLALMLQLDRYLFLPLEFDVNLKIKSEDGMILVRAGSDVGEGLSSQPRSCAEMLWWVLSWSGFWQALSLISWKILKQIQQIQWWCLHWGTLFTQGLLRGCTKLLECLSLGFKLSFTASIWKEMKTLIVLQCATSFNYSADLWATTWFIFSLPCCCSSCDHQLLEWHLCTLVPFSLEISILYGSGVTQVWLLFPVNALNS